MDDEETDEIPLTVLEPFTGPFSSLAEEHFQGTELAAEQVNANDDLDVTFELNDYDTQLDAEDAIQEANSALQSDGSQFYIGCISSSVALAMNDFARRNEVIYMPSAADISITGANCNQWVFRFETSTAQIAEVMAQWTAETLGDQIFYHVADYAYGNSVLEEIETRMTDLSGGYEEVGVTRSDPGSSDFDAFITQISNASDEADALVVGMTGGDLAIFLNQARDRGLHEEIPIVTTTGSFRAVRAGAGNGAYDIYSGTRYNPAIETGDNQAFVSAYEDEYGGLPDSFSRTGYESVRTLAAGIDEAGSTDPAEVRQVMAGRPFDTIFGPVEYRECDQQASNPVWMAECVEPAGGGDMAEVELLDGWMLSGEEAAPDCADTGCEL